MSPDPQVSMLNACDAFTGPQEGETLWMILDSVGRATVGRGHELPTIQSAAEVFGISTDEAKPQWDALMKMPPARLAAVYEPVTMLRLTEDRSRTLFRSDLQYSLDECTKRVPGFWSVPIPVAVAVNDINYNTGNVLTFPKFLAFVASGDWVGAATESDRPQLPKRSAATKALILSAMSLQTMT